MRPYRYFSYGLHIHSDVALPLWPATAESPAAAPDIEIERLPPRPLEREMPPAGYEFRFSAEAGELSTKFVGRFEVRAGRPVRIVAEPLPETPDDLLAHFLSGNILGMGIHFHGFLALHGCAVQMNDTTAVFMGPSGMGKSTLCAALCRLGHTIVTDDISPVHWIGGRPHVMPGYPRMKLNQDVIEALEIAADELYVLHGEHCKMGWLRPEAHIDSPKPIDRLFVLGIGEMKIQPLKGLDAFASLQRCATPSQWGFEGGTAHFFACSRLVNAVPVHLFVRERNLNRLLEQAEWISGIVENGEIEECLGPSFDATPSSAV